MGKRKARDDAQLSLFENQEPSPFINKQPSVVDLIRARFERNPDMTQEEYKKWIKILVLSSLRSFD